MIKKISIKGFRGFGNSDKEFEFSLPNAVLSSGLNILVGQNNSGKSTVLESMKFFTYTGNKISFSMAKRNIKNNDSIEIKTLNENDETTILKTIKSGGSEAEFSNNNLNNIIYIPSRRSFNRNFPKDPWKIETLQQSASIFRDSNRQNDYSEFTYMYDELQKNQADFQKLLEEVTNFPKWTIDLDESGNYFFKVVKNDGFHTSEGMGDGLISILTMVGMLYLSKKGSTVIIDEPELSLHPEVIKSLLEVIKRYSKDRQIIISTHSPYLIDIESITNGAKIFRVINDDNNIEFYELSEESIKFFRAVVRDNHFPHAFGLNTKEIFFIEDNIVVVEGQEDVVGYSKLLKEFDLKPFKFYGWGAGGAGNIINVVKVLKDLGFKKIACIYDGDKEDDYLKYKPVYEDVHFEIIPTDDIRDKHNDKNDLLKQGLLDKKFNLKIEYKKNLEDIFNNIRNYFNE
jgi:AAA15 family ATPase/GTPase